MWYKKTAMILAAVGAINWGLTTFDFNVVNLIFGSWAIIENIVYWIVALSGVYALVEAFK